MKIKEEIIDFLSVAVLIAIVFSLLPVTLAVFTFAALEGVDLWIKVAVSIFVGLLFTIVETFIILFDDGD